MREAGPRNDGSTARNWLEPFVRQYSLSADSQDATLYRIGVLKEVSGRGGSAAAHWPKDALRLERFAPELIERTLPDTAFEVEVEFAVSGTTVGVGADETILDAAERAGLPVVSSCKTGTRGTCETPLLSGRADHRDSILTPSEQGTNETTMICVSLRRVRLTAARAEALAPSSRRDRVTPRTTAPTPGGPGCTDM